MKLESFEIHILWFAIKYGVYTESLAERTAYLAMRRKRNGQTALLSVGQKLSTVRERRYTESNVYLADPQRKKQKDLASGMHVHWRRIFVSLLYTNTI